VKNSGNAYECKPYPYTGWCNGAAWAYAPGTGTYWQDAWTLVGPCAGRIHSIADDASGGESGLTIFPNPAIIGNQSVTFGFDKNPNKVLIHLQNLDGSTISSYQYSDIKENKLTILLPLLSHGVYLFHVRIDDEFRVRKYIIKE